MGTVTIAANVYEIYGTNTAAIIYHAASMSPAGIAFAAAIPGTQDKSLVAASRLLDRQRWAGTPVVTPVIDAELEWPRDGVIDRYGTAVSNLTVPVDIVIAAYELAAMILVDSSVEDLATSGGNIASVQAGPAAVSFFRPTLGITGRFATKIQELVGQYLAGNVSAAGEAGEAFGTDVESAFDAEDSYALERSI